MITARPIEDYYPDGVPPQPSRAARVRAAQDEPEPVNVDAAVQVLGPGVFWFAGRKYVVPRVPFVEGIQLQALLLRLRRLRTASMAPAASAEEEADRMKQALTLFRESVEIFPRVARPAGWSRFVWRLLPNPFRRASPAEVGELLGFLYGCQTRSSVGYS
jgi:hypothetical protein